MPKNTYKVKSRPSKQEGETVFSFIENKLSLSNVFQNGLPLKYLPYIFFVMVIAIFYIGNNHYTEKTIRKINKVEQQVEDLKAHYRTLQADYMHARLQSEVAKKVDRIGLKESSAPPKKIVIKKGEY